MTRSVLRLLLLTLLIGGLSSMAGLAQPATELPQAKVRYDADLLHPSFHESRRDAVLEALPPNSIAVFFSAPVRNRQNDVDFEYRQSSDLYYLTGTHEPGSVLVLAPDGVEVGGDTVQALLMVPPRNPTHEVWEGRLFGADRAATELGFEKTVEYDRFEALMKQWVNDEGRQVFHLPLPDDVDPDSPLGQQLAVFEALVDPLEIDGDHESRTVINALLTVDDADTFQQLKTYLAANPLDTSGQSDERVQEALKAFEQAADLTDWVAWRKHHLAAADASTLRNLLTYYRSIKTEEELAVLRRAIEITDTAHVEAAKSIEPGMYEYEVEALIEYVFKRNGAQYTGFPSIVGSGENSVILHYTSNRRQMEAEDLVVIDIGAEYHGYSADITRTYPVNGVFSPEQNAIYGLVLAANEAGIAASRAGASFGAPHQAASRVLSQGLYDLGILDDPSDARGLSRFFMHGTSHYLGLDVHDAGTYGRLEPGNLITVEPGLYIAPASDIDPKWWNIGVRIEDDVLITDGDPVVLSLAPKTIEAIEALMQDTGLGNAEAGKLGRD